MYTILPKSCRYGHLVTFPPYNAKSEMTLHEILMKSLVALAAARHGRYLLTNGGHMDMYDDQKAWFDGLIHFLKDVDTGRF